MPTIRCLYDGELRGLGPVKFFANACSEAQEPGVVQPHRLTSDLRHDVGAAVLRPVPRDPDRPTTRMPQLHVRLAAHPHASQYRQWPPHERVHRQRDGHALIMRR